MQNNPRSHGLWEITAPAAPATTSLTGATRAEVVVIGGGYTGLSTALHLAEAGRDVVLLEAVEIGFGGAGRNVGLVNAGMWVMPDAVVASLGATEGERLIAFLGDGPAQVWDIIARHSIRCEASHTGTLHVAADQSGLRDLVARHEQWSRRGAPVQLLGQAATADRLGSARYHGALLDMRAGTIQPLAYARGLARAAIAQGARIFTGSAATGMQAGPRGWQVETPRGAVTAAQVVFATDAYTQHLMPQIRTQQAFLPYFNMATPPLPNDIARTILPGREGAWDTRDVLTSFRLDDQNRLIFGSVGALRGGGQAIHRAWAKRALNRIFPQIGPVTFQAEWFGTIGMTNDHLPRFHQLADGVVSFCGYNGRGIAPGTAFGRFLAAWLQGSTDALPLQPSAAKPLALRALHSAYYETGAQAYHLIDAYR
ncbi:MAG: FAD-binding oxidoreductase [Paracoccus sp. (in: a-proteobacteria)]|nr:FAD-binding oxidoreductase [Paracoccus sp. (in: a-proteobacteria)]